MKKLIKEVCPTVGKIWKYAPFPAGTLPAVLVKKDPQKSYVWLPEQGQGKGSHPQYRPVGTRMHKYLSVVDLGRKVL